MALRVRAATLGMILLTLIPGLPPARAALAQGSTGIEIGVTILPAPGEGTVSAVLSQAALAPAGDGAVMRLVVADDRGSPEGWQVKIAQVPVSDPDGLLWIQYYRRRAEQLSGQPVEESTGPRGRRLAVGQPLDDATAVFVAAPGTGAGIYSVQFTLRSEMGAPITRQRLILTIPAAP